MNSGIKIVIALVVIAALATGAYFYFSRNESRVSQVEKDCRTKAKWSVDTMNAARTSSGLKPYGKEDEDDIYRQCMEKKSQPIN